MNRVETAINDGRCVIAIGARALATAEVQAEMRRRPLPFIALSGDPVNPAVGLSAESLAPALSQPGGVVVLVEAEAAADGRGLGELERLIKEGDHKPRLTVAARSFNPFALPPAIRLLKMDHEKQRAVDFMASLPVPALGAVLAQQAGVVAAAAPKAKAVVAKARAPRPTLVGREEELAALAALLDVDGSPIIVKGPSGSGRRWLIEAALSASELKRVPDFTFSRGSGIDAFASVLAMLARESGDPSLHEALTAKDAPAPAALADLIVSVAQGQGLADKVWVLHGLDTLLDRRDCSFYRSGRLEMALRKLLVSELKLRLVFPATMAATFYREGEAAIRRDLVLGGLKGRELHELFAAWHAPEFPRDRFGAIQERVHGHPVAARCFALALSETEDGDVEALLEQPRFMKADALDDHRQTEKLLKKRIEALSEEDRNALHAAAMPRIPLEAEALIALGIERKQRLGLLSAGLLEQTTGNTRNYYVHPLVQIHLSRRQIDDFARMEEFGLWCLGRASELKKGGKLVDAVALALEGNRLLTDARRLRSRMRLPYPDLDPDIENIRNLVRRRAPRLDIARMRVNELRKYAPNNTELLLSEIDLLVNEKATVEVIQKAFDDIAAAAPTPEVFHTEASWHQTRNARGRAVTALERGVEAFPEDARMLRRLAGFYISQNRNEDAAATLKRAQEIEPMMPDTYGMMGEIQAELGPESWDLAVENIEEALRLAPGHPIHLARKARLLRLRSMIDNDRRTELLNESEALLRDAIKAEKDNRRVQVLLATVLIDNDGDLEQARWLLQQAMKQRTTGRRRDNPAALIQRARLLVRDAAWEEAERLLARAIKLEPSNHTAFAARGELLAGKGELVPAFEAWKTARERSPRYAAERGEYDRALAGLATAIEAAAAAAPAVPTVEVQTPASTTRPGATVLRKHETDGDGEAPVVESADAEDISEDAAPAVTEEAPAAESAVVEEAPAVEPAVTEEAPAVEPAVADAESASDEATVEG